MIRQAHDSGTRCVGMVLREGYLCETVDPQPKGMVPRLPME